MRTGKVSHPVARRFVDRVLQGFRAENDWNDLWNLNHTRDVLGGVTEPLGWEQNVYKHSILPCFVW